jgi:hypothetical protein
MLGFGFVTIEVWHAQLPVWAFILALIIGEFLNTPCGILDLMGVFPPIQHSRTRSRLVLLGPSRTK